MHVGDFCRIRTDEPQSRPPSLPRLKFSLSSPSLNLSSLPSVLHPTHSPPPNFRSIASHTWPTTWSSPSVVLAKAQSTVHTCLGLGARSRSGVPFRLGVSAMNDLNSSSRTSLVHGLEALVSLSDMPSAPRDQIQLTRSRLVWARSYVSQKGKRDLARPGWVGGICPYRAKPLKRVINSTK